MGDPKRQRKQYATPLRPWDRERIIKEADLTRKYGLKSKKEVWKTETILRDFRREARKLMAETGEQADKEAKQLLSKLQNLKLVGKDSSIVDVLKLGIENVLDRRLQSVVYKRGLAKTTTQARQLIVHGHIVVGDRCVTEPGYLVSGDEEQEVAHHPSSSYKDIIKPEEVKSNRPAATTEEK